MPTGDDYAKTHAYSAVVLLMGRTHYRVSSKLGPKEFVPFLRHLLAYHSGKQLLVMHGQGAQYTGAAVENVVREARGRLMLKAQPAYSPELNPQERIWKWVRRVVTHNHWFATLREPLEAIRDFFRYLASIKDQVRRFCGFKTPDSLVAPL
jgi:transposase